MVVQHHIISLYIIISAFKKGIAEIHIIEGYCKTLVEAAKLFKPLLLKHQAGSGHPHHIVDIPVSSIIMVVLIIQKLQLMRRSHMQIGNPGMLDHSRIRIQELGTYCSHPLQHCLFCQLHKPVSLNDLHVIIQEKKQISFCHGRSQITHP